MHAAVFRSCMLGVALVVCAVLAAPAFADPSAPSGLAAVARSDHRVDLSWSWPTSPSYPDELQIWRDGAFLVSVPAATTKFTDTIATAGSTHHYQLVTVTGSVASDPIPADPGVLAKVRADAANPATGISVSFTPGSTIATVSWTRGAMDSDVTYTAIAQQGSGTPITRTVKYADPGTAGSITIDGLASYSSYQFTVDAVEDSEPPNDMGGTVHTTDAIAPVTARTPDIIAPQLAGDPVATRVALGTLSVTWPSASDSGQGVQNYNVCVDSTCGLVPFDPLAGSTQTALPGAPNVPNDGASHTVSVVAIDYAGNSSGLISTAVVMPKPATPSIVLTSGGTGCAPLVATVTSPEAGTPNLAYHLIVDGVQNDALIGQQITGAPYQLVSLTAQASYGSDLSAVSAPLPERVVDPDGPEASPQVHGLADPSSGTETLSWDLVNTTGAPVAGYQITSTGATTVPGYGGSGVFVPQSSAPGTQLVGLAQSVGYLIHVVTVDACGRASSPSADRLFRLDDNENPTAPGLNPPTTSGHDVHLTWTPSTDNVAVDDYRVYRDSTFIGRTSGLSMDDLNLPDAATYTYTVVASDTAGNSSARSTPRTVTTKDLTPPSAPGLVKATPAGGNVLISWGAATDNVGVAGYRISRTGVGGTVTMNVSGSGSTSYVDKNLKAGSYQWTVQAIDAAGNVSQARIATAISSGLPTATTASTLKLVSANGAPQSFRVGGKSGARIALSFKLKDAFAPAYLRLQVLSGKAKVRISLPAGSGRNTPGKRLGEKVAKKGVLKIAIGSQKAGTLRLVVTAKGGLVTISGMVKGSRAPTIVPGPS